jgi:hypothetical protein
MQVWIIKLILRIKVAKHQTKKLTNDELAPQLIEALKSLQTIGLIPSNVKLAPLFGIKNASMYACIPLTTDGSIRSYRTMIGLL